MPFYYRKSSEAITPKTCFHFYFHAKENKLSPRSARDSVLGPHGNVNRCINGPDKITFFSLQTVDLIRRVLTRPTDVNTQNFKINIAVIKKKIVVFYLNRTR